MEFSLGTASLKEIYRSSAGCVYQSELSNQIVLEFQNDLLSFNIPCFFAFKRQVEKIDLQKMLLDSSPGSDIEIIKPCGVDKVFVLTLREIAELKSLMEGSRFMFELNRLLSDNLCYVCHS